jgi:hypothetical protein
MRTMTRTSLLLIKLTLVLSLLVSVLSGCGSFKVSEQYPLESVNKNGSETSYVYRAAGQTVPEVAKLLADKRKPDQISKEDPERMFLVYSDEWYHLQKDAKKPEDTLVEVDSKQYVQKNYNPSFLEGYLVASLIGNLFSGIGSYGNYRGYSSMDTYKPSQQYHTPTVQEKKAAPPITVQKSGSIITRGLSKAESTVGSSGSITKKTSDPASSGSIIRGPNSGSGSGSINPPKTSAPKTKVGSGSITKRSSKR